jgi:type II secretory pathway component PulC
LLVTPVMKTMLLRGLMLTLLTGPAIAHADDVRPARSVDIREARLVPVTKDGTFIGLRVYSVRAGGRFDQPQARFQNGDLIETIDGVAVTTGDGTIALHDKVILGTADASITVRRKGQLVTLASKAIP